MIVAIPAQTSAQAAAAQTTQATMQATMQAKAQSFEQSVPGSEKGVSDRPLAKRDMFTGMDMIERETVQKLITAKRYDGSMPSYGGWTPSPGVAFLSSAILPGSAQILSGRAGRGIAYAAIEAATLAIYAGQTRKARDKERRYERFANGNWSVVNYAVWLVGYHDMHNLSNPYLNQLRQVTQGLQPAYDIGVDWPSIPIELLRNVERNTLYVYRMSRGQNTFSHVMPDYGSQQYYELISKYYQYGPGWSDFPADKFVLPWDGSEMSAQFYEGRDQAETFNDHYRLASNMVSLLIVNHIFSAFDAYFTVKLDASRLTALPPVSSEQAFRFRWAF